MSNLQRPNDLSGEVGLLVAVIAQAAKDATYGRGKWRADAWRYFAGGAYEEHLSWLGLPPDLLPAPIMEMAQYEARSFEILVKQ